MKTMILTMFALAAIATTAVPTASAWACATPNQDPVSAYATRECNYVASGGPADDAADTIAFATTEAGEAVAFVLGVADHYLP